MIEIVSSEDVFHDSKKGMPQSSVTWGFGDTDEFGYSFYYQNGNQMGLLGGKWMQPEANRHIRITYRREPIMVSTEFTRQMAEEREIQMRESTARQYYGRKSVGDGHQHDVAMARPLGNGQVEPVIYS